MPKRDPFRLPYTRGLPGLETLYQTLKQKRPRIGITQGGSSRADAGAKVAATSAQLSPTTKRF